MKSSAVVVGEARARAVRLRSCADIPVVVPNERSKKEMRLDVGGRTVFVVYGNSVRCPVSVFVFGDHHWEVELLKPVAGESAADVSAGMVGRK